MPLLKYVLYDPGCPNLFNISFPMDSISLQLVVCEITVYSVRLLCLMSVQLGSDVHVYKVRVTNTTFGTYS